jgi:hypothetical protein
MDRRFAAEEMYVVDGGTFEAVAAATGIAANTLKTWSATEDWPARREDYRKSLATIRANTVKLRANLLKKALETMDPQAVYAFSRVEDMAARAAGVAASAPAEPIGEPIAINTPADAVAALEKVVEKKIAILLGRPDSLSLSALRDLQKTMQLVAEMKAKYAPEAAEKGPAKGLSQETVDAIERGLKLV